MIASALALALSPPGPALRPPSHFLSATEACLSAVGAGGVDETRLVATGWLRVTTDPEEAASSIRTYAHQGAVPIYLTIGGALARGCIAQADALPQGGLPALFAQFDSAFGPPRLAVGNLRQWQRGRHSILFSGGSSPSSPVGFAINYLSGASE